MRLVNALATLTLLPCMQAAPAPCGGHGTRGSMLVSSAWLKDHSKDPNLVLLAVGPKGDFAQSHIPGSAYIDYSEIQVKGDLTLELPPMPQLADVFGKVGVSNNSRVVLYSINPMNPAQTTRVYLTLDAMGLGAQTSILDGGLPEWKAQGGAVNAEAAAPKPAKLTPCPQTDVITNLEYVSSNLHKPGVDIVDARTPNFFSGATASNNRTGHIPGAVNLTFSTMVDDKGKLKSAETLTQMFHDAGVKTGDRVVAYCHIGQQATVIYFVSRYLGYDVRLYDGSWEEWAHHPELPVEPAKAEK